ncbi:hypothetical protein J3R30DRAFT_14409 [Lentinula aciculospora]|uniref:Uncharacterized protein n=1 Tax=Lentinula aciculospora TaxID=153920 RepID=A0A9W9DWR8_9AGAR|nr:hypothetical protein J3R30DRAFT_14409 [Lentinula aciculospora]
MVKILFLIPLIVVLLVPLDSLMSIAFLSISCEDFRCLCHAFFVPFVLHRAFWVFATPSLLSQSRRSDTILNFLKQT